MTFSLQHDQAIIYNILFISHIPGAQQAKFVQYKIRYEYMAVPGARFVSSVAANLTASAGAASSISASAGSSLWKVTLFASNDEDGANRLAVFPDVALSVDQASQSFVPGGLIQFSIPLK